MPSACTSYTTPISEQRWEGGRSTVYKEEEGIKERSERILVYDIVDILP
jgi:hypothetical protein